jgi:hypothetical protein
MLAASTPAQREFMLVHGVRRAQAATTRRAPQLLLLLVRRGFGRGVLVRVTRLLRRVVPATPVLVAPCFARVLLASWLTRGGRLCGGCRPAASGEPRRESSDRNEHQFPCLTSIHVNLPFGGLLGYHGVQCEACNDCRYCVVSGITPWVGSLSASACTEGAQRNLSKLEDQ